MIPLITYLGAIILGAITALVFKDSTIAAALFMNLSSYAMRLGAFIFLPMILFALPPAAASLKKYHLTRKVIIPSLYWSLLTAFILPLLCAFAIYFIAIPFPASSTAGTEGYFTSILPSSFSSAGDSLFSGNIVYTLSKLTDFFLPAIIFSYLFGLALKPDMETVKPAYRLMNSFSVVMYRIARMYKTLGFILLYPVSSLFFLELIQEKTLLLYPALPLFLFAAALFIGLIILPLLLSALTLFKVNGWFAIFKSLPVLLSAFFTGSYVFASPMLESTLKDQFGIRRRVSSSSIPLLSVTGRAGSASVAVICALSVIFSATGSMPSLYEVVVITLLCCLASFSSSIAGGGLEAVFIIAIAFQLADINLYGAEMTIIGVLPLISALSASLDIEIGLFGALLCDRRIKVYNKVEENNW